VVDLPLERVDLPWIARSTIVCWAWNRALVYSM